jgi:hypothetical protein
VRQGALHGLALRIHDRLLRSNDDLRFHAWGGGPPPSNARMMEKAATPGEKIL